MSTVPVMFYQHDDVILSTILAQARLRLELFEFRQAEEWEGGQSCFSIVQNNWAKCERALRMSYIEGNSKFNFDSIVLSMN